MRRHDRLGRGCQYRDPDCRINHHEDFCGSLVGGNPDGIHSRKYDIRRKRSCNRDSGHLLLLEQIRQRQCLRSQWTANFLWPHATLSERGMDRYTNTAHWMERHGHTHGNKSELYIYWSLDNTLSNWFEPRVYYHAKRIRIRTTLFSNSTRTYPAGNIYFPGGNYKRLDELWLWKPGLREQWG